MEDKRLTGWTEERVETLKKMWGEGCSAAEIAKALGFEKRNPVCGKIARLGLGRIKRIDREKAKREREATSKEQKLRAPKSPRTQQDLPPSLTEASVGRLLRKRVAAEEVKPEPFVVKDAADVIPLHLSLLDLEPDECRWPYGDGAFTFCGCKKITDGPYCYAHDRLSKGQGTASERAVAPIPGRRAA